MDKREARYYNVPVNNFHFCRFGTKEEYDHNRTAKDNGIEEYDVIYAQIY